MLAVIRNFFSAPVFPDDEDKTIAATMAHFGIVFGLVANVIQLPMLILAGDSVSRSLLFSVTMIFALLLNHYFLRLGYVRSSSAVFILVAWIMLAGANYSAGGVQAPGFTIHVVFVICVGFVFGGRWAFVAAGCSTLLGLLFIFLEQKGLLPSPQVENTPLRHFVILSSNLVIVAGILSIMVNRMRAIIAAGRRELFVRRETEWQLEKYQSGLEDTVRIRTEALAQTNAALTKEVDDRRRAEVELRLEKDFIALLMETSPVGILVVDAACGFTFANASAERALRRTRADIVRLGCTSAEWGFVDYGGRPLPAEELPFFKALATGVAVRNVPLAAATPEGTQVLLSVSVAPFGEEREGTRRCVATIEDVTERQRLEREVLRAQKLESVGVLAGGIAHDFNNLLTGILGNISLAQLDVPAGSPIAEALGEAEKASFQARELTQQLLTFSRGGAPVKSPLAIAEVVEHAVQFALRGSNVRGVCAIPRVLWAVEADQGQVNQVFHNLVINAAQSMPAGGTIEVNAANVLLGDESGVPLPAGKYVRVALVDHGVGIAPGNLERIFDPFFTTKKEGTGLGLAVVFSIVKSHGGHIGVASSEGRGSTFTVHLPATTAAVPAAVISPSVCAGRGRVLVMDDEPAVRSVTSRILATLGYEVHTTENGAEALAAFRLARAEGSPFAAVILDLTIPGGMGGAETLRHLREIDPAVRAVVSSGYSNDPVMSNYKEQGFCNVIVKPYRSSDLSRVMREVCRGDDAAAASTPGDALAPACGSSPPSPD